MDTDLVVDVERRRRVLRRMARACLVLVVLVVVLSAFMRHRMAGVGCADWPACYGQAQEAGREGSAPAFDEDIALARLAHRAVASLVLVLVVAMLLGSLAPRPALRREAALAGCLLVLALGLAVLGVASSGSRSHAVTAGNLLGGFAMLALCARLLAVAGAAPGTRRDPVPFRGVAAVCGLLLLQACLGVLASASLALPEAPIHLAHRVGAIAASGAVLALGLLAWRRGRRRSALALAGVLLAVLALGLVIGAGTVAMPVILLHNLGAAGLLALAARLE